MPPEFVFEILLYFLSVRLSAGGKASELMSQATPADPSVGSAPSHACLQSPSKHVASLKELNTLPSFAGSCKQRAKHAVSQELQKVLRAELLVGGVQPPDPADLQRCPKWVNLQVLGSRQPPDASANCVTTSCCM